MGRAPGLAAGFVADDGSCVVSVFSTLSSGLGSGSLCVFAGAGSGASAGACGAADLPGLGADGRAPGVGADSFFSLGDAAVSVLGFGLDTCG